MTTKPETQTVRVVLDLTVSGSLKMGENDGGEGRDIVREHLNSALKSHGDTVREAGHIAIAGLDEATSMIHRWYRDEVREYAQSIPEEFARQSDDPADRGDFGDFLHEHLDGAGCVIYTRLAKLVLMASDNEDAYSEEMGEAAPDVSAAAFMALRADVSESIYGEHPDIHEGRLSTDVDPDDEEEDEEDEAA